MDTILPPGLPASLLQWNYLDLAKKFSSPTTGTQRTQGRLGTPWSISIDTALMEGELRARFISWLAMMQGGAGRVYVPVPGFSIRGGWEGFISGGGYPPNEAIANNKFVSGLTNWSVYGGGITLTTADRVLRSERADITTLGVVASGPAIPFNGTGVMRAMILPGKGTPRGDLRVGSTVGGTDYGSLAFTSAGMVTTSFAPLGSPLYFGIADYITSKAIGDFWETPYVSVARCPLVADAAQTGNTLRVYYLPASQNNILSAGDFVEINDGELHMLAAPLNSNSSGYGHMVFTRPMRKSPTVLSPVIVHNPLCKMILMGDKQGWSTQPPVVSRSTVQLVEDIT